MIMPQTSEPLTKSLMEMRRELMSQRNHDGSHSTGTQNHSGDAPHQAPHQCCLVQIYPADVVTGMMLLEADYLVAGRDVSMDLVIDDHSVSRQHVAFIQEPDGYRVRDLGSTNGTLVNGERVCECRLHSGDTIQLGAFIFKFLSADSVESKYHETVYSAITRDALTGAMNRRYLLESLRRELARAVRQQTVVSVLMLDIDHFKQVNDTQGHLVGDEVLREFGARLLAVCRDDDLLARYGGEEFCIVLSSTTRHDALEMAERCRAAIAERRFQTSAGDLSISASFGLACFDPQSPTTAHELLRAADERLYEAKRRGRNRVVA
ncbi:MAG: diguanylate cyclase [Planctomycetaceae bacterium]